MIVEDLEANVESNLPVKKKKKSKTTRAVKDEEQLVKKYGKKKKRVATLDNIRREYNKNLYPRTGRE